jgi:hypothetical protein
MRPSRSRSLVFVLLALARITGTLRAQAPSTVEGGAFLLLPVGARATALGQAAVAEGGTTEALFWNPAGLADLKTSEAALHHYLAFFGTGDALVVSVPTSALGVFTVAGYVVDYGDLIVTTITGQQIGTVTPRNVELAASYATSIAGGLSAGITYKLIQFRVDCSGDCSQVPTAVGTTHAVDIGLRYALPGAAPVVVGVAIRNLGFDLQVNNEAQADPLPTRIAVGAAWLAVRPPRGVEGLDVRVLADVQGSVGTGSLAPATLIGVESGVKELFRLRVGYSFLESNARGPSFGLGLKVGRVGLDLARTFYATDLVGEQEPLHVSFRVTF